jgi:plasmid stability protein
MSTITLKNIPPDLHEELKKRAEEHHRSLNREILAILQGADQSRRTEPAALIREARTIRKKFKREISPAQIRAWIRRGRK